MFTPSRHSNCSWLATTAASALLLGVYGASAHAAGANAQIHSNGFSVSIIKVVSENGTSWTKIVDGTIQLPVKVKIGMPGHNVTSYTVRQTGQPGGQYLELNYAQVDQVEYSKVYSGWTQYLTAAERQAIIANCNTNLGKGKGIRETHNMFGNAGVELAAGFDEVSHTANGSKADFDGTGSHKATANVAVHVRCEGKLAAADGYATVAPDFAAKGIHLRFMTSVGHPIVANPATRCQLARTKVRVETSKPGAVKFRLWTRVGNEPMQSEVVDAWSSFVGPGKYEASFFKPFHVSKTTSVQAMAEDMTNAIGQSSGWKSVTVHCTGAGGGGLASTPNTANPDNLPPQASPKPPMRFVPGAAVGLKVAPVPTAPRVPQRVWQGRVVAGPVGPVAAKAQFQRAKPHVN